MLGRIYRKMLSSQKSKCSRDSQEQESITLLSNLLEDPSTFFEAAERFALSIIFKATYGIRLASLHNPVVVELYHIWERLLRCKRSLSTIFFLTLLRFLTDVQPGTVLLPDTFPMLLKLPTWMQPWHFVATSLTKRELKIHSSFVNRLKTLAQTTSVPDCYGMTLLKVKSLGALCVL